MSSIDPVVSFNDLAITHPCGSKTAEPGWGRDRETSLALRDHELWLVWGGRGWMRDRHNQTHELRPGFCAWMRPGGIYDAGTSDTQPLGFTYIHFTGSFSTEPPEFFEVADLAFTDLATRRIIESIDRATPDRWGESARANPATLTLLQAVLLDLLHTPARQDRGPHETALTTLAAQMRHDPASSISIAQMAEDLGVSAAHFSRLFRQRFGKSPQQYRVAARIERACHELKESSHAVSRIADLLGYADAFAFSKQFKQFTGRSPSAYRKGQS
ncbi:helix-turn-helix domain-containing protein [Algisphaera agarilytica]|uniref:AraC-like DNA-binding protein n=1 Tax=Algisphaera agarilytica TaxID=1385975 RepID=A0A7X0H9I7_9BACT|nr:AraC family transcriptional regulator [Algisphaera agarilytica]MBB6431602.1 AraC-like DNA-binding protein [Algisphaera agarilytica]